MPITCNAVGDIIALVQLGIKIADVLNESRNAPADCRALCNDLRSLERLVTQSQPTIDGLQDHKLRELVRERLENVSRQIMDGLKLICNFNTAFDASINLAEHHWRQVVKYWARKSKQSINWALKHNASARDARATIAQSFTSLIFALLVAFQADQRTLVQTLHDAYDRSATQLTQLAQNLGFSQNELRADVSEVKSFFEKLLVVLDAVREEVSELGERLERNLTMTQVDITAVRQQLRELQTVIATTTTVERAAELTQATIERTGTSTHSTIERVGVTTLESIERLEVTVQQGFSAITHHGLVNNHQCDSNQVAVWLAANPVLLGFARLLYSQDIRQAYGPTTQYSVLAESQPSTSLVVQLSREVTSPTAIACAFLLALRANTTSERAAYAVLSFLLFLTSKTLQLYNNPLISHVVIFVDIFYRDDLDVTTLDTKFPTSSRRILISHLNKSFRQTLLRQRNLNSELHYEPQDTLTHLSRRSTGDDQLLHQSNSKNVSMTFLIQGHRDTTKLVNLDFRQAWRRMDSALHFPFELVTGWSIMSTQAKWSLILCLKAIEA